MLDCNYGIVRLRCVAQRAYEDTRSYRPVPPGSSQPTCSPGVPWRKTDPAGTGLVRLFKNVPHSHACYGQAGREEIRSVGLGVGGPC